MNAGRPVAAARPLAAYKALIKVGYGCNEHCTFCHTQDVRHIDGESSEVVRKIHRAHELGYGMVVLSGGEPTIRPELFDWATLVARLGMDLGLVTNGLVLGYRDVVERLLARRLRYVYQSLHGGSAVVHNRLVRARTFEAARAAVANLAGRGLDYTLNCVVTKQNLDHLDELVDFALAYPDVTLKFSMVQPKGGGEHDFTMLTPRVADVARHVVAAIERGTAEVRARGAVGPRFAHDGIPLCLLPGHEGLYDDLKTHRFMTMVEIGEPDFFPVDDLAKLQPESVCGACSLRGPCPGLFAGYLEHYDASELRPRLGAPRSNSFNYVLEAVVATDADEAHCPLRDGREGITPWDRARHLYVRNGRKVARYRTETRDFCDAELTSLKFEDGQLYVDVSRKPAPDDFARDLVKLERMAACAACPHDAACTGTYVPRLDDDPFTRDDQVVRDHVSGLRGAVLDVGCGHGPYGELLGASATAGHIRYVGLEPDGALVASLRARWPFAEVIEGMAESLTEVEAYDHVLVLRSYNHLRDPDAAFAAIARALRPGGEVFVVDNVAFGLVRTRAQAVVAERSSAALEHYRNDRADAVLTLAPRHGLEVLDHRGVGPGTSNQWWVRLGKPAHTNAWPPSRSA